MRGYLLLNITQFDNKRVSNVTWTHWETLEDAWFSVCTQVGRDTELDAEQQTAFAVSQSVQAERCKLFWAVLVPDESHWFYLRLGLSRTDRGEACFKAKFKPHFYNRRSSVFGALNQQTAVTALDAKGVEGVEGGGWVSLNKERSRFVVASLASPKAF